MSYICGTTVSAEKDSTLVLQGKDGSSICLPLHDLVLVGNHASILGSESLKLRHHFLY